MIETFKNVLVTLHSLNFFPEVALFALAAYFIVRQWLKAVNPRYAIYIPIIASLLGEYAFTSELKDMQDCLMMFVLGVIQAGVAVGIYSMADKYGLMDKVGDAISKRFGGQAQG